MNRFNNKDGDKTKSTPHQTNTISTNQSMCDDCTNQTSWKEGRQDHPLISPLSSPSPIWIWIWMVRLMRTTTSFEAGRPSLRHPATVTPYRIWHPKDWGIDPPYGHWSGRGLNTEHGGKGQERDVRLVQFFCYGNRWSPTVGEISPVRSCGAQRELILGYVCICLSPMC